MSDAKIPLAERWRRIMEEIKPPKKRAPRGGGPDEWAGYPFIAWDDLGESLRPLLAKHGVLVDVEIESVEYERSATARGGQRVTATVHMVIRRQSVDGEVDLRRWVGQAADVGTGDKAVQKAVTIGLKYWLLKSLCIGDAASDETGTVEVPRPPARRKQPKADDLAERRAHLRRRALAAGKQIWEQVAEAASQHGGVSGLPLEEIERLEALVDSSVGEAS